MDAPPVPLLELYRRLLLIRRFEEHIIEQYAEQNAYFARKESPPHTIKCPTHLSIGQEGAAVGICAALTPQDQVYSTHRCHAHYLAKGGDPGRGLAEIYGKATGCCHGKGGSMHLVDPSVGMMGASAIVGGSIPLAVGAALWARQMGLPHVGVAFFGDGAVEQGVFHESLNLASVRRLPAIFFCENNGYATLSHQSARQIRPIHARAESYGAVGVEVDGNDVEAVLAVSREAVARARAGGGPTLIEAHTYRWYAHVGTEPDTGRMRRSAEELLDWQARCPVKRAAQALRDRGLPASALAAVEAEVNTRLAEAILFARQSPEPALSELFTDVG